MMKMRKTEMKTPEETPTWRMMVMPPKCPTQPHPCHHSCCPRLCRVQDAAQEKVLDLPSTKKRIVCFHHQLRISRHNRSGHRHPRLCQNPSHVAVHWSHGSLWRTLSISRMTSCKDGVAWSRS